MPLNTNLPSILDEELLSSPGEEYFWPWIKKHRPELTDTGKNAGEFSDVASARSCYARTRKKSRIQQAVRA